MAGFELLYPIVVTQRAVQIGHSYTVFIYEILTEHNISRTREDLKNTTAPENLRKELLCVKMSLTRLSS